MLPWAALYRAAFLESNIKASDPRTNRKSHCAAMPPKKRKRGRQHKLPPGLRKAQEAARDAKAAVEAEKPAVESTTEPVSQLRPAIPVQPVQLQNQTTLLASLGSRSGGRFYVARWPPRRA